MKSILVILAVLFSAVISFAHGDHHSLSKEDVPVAAKTHITKLVTEKKLDSTWNQAVAVAEKTEKKTVGGKNRWVAVFKHEKSTLELTMTPAGKLVDYKVSGK